MASIQKAVVSELFLHIQCTLYLDERPNIDVKIDSPLTFVIFPVKIETAHVSFSDRLFSVCLSVCKHAFLKK